jgi:probable phosphoglycerate mutase
VQGVTRLVLVRHGESQAQRDGFLSGHSTCLGLSPLGRRQAEALGARLAVSGELGAVDAVYTSILPRSIETAQIVLAGAGFDHAPVSDCDFCELHPGEAEGLTWEVMRERFPPGPTDDPHLRRMPTMETWAEMYERAGWRLQAAADAHAGGTVLVVAHGGTVGASFVVLGGVSPAMGIGLTRETVNASLTEWQLRRGTWVLVHFNDTAHLAGVAAEA